MNWPGEASYAFTISVDVDGDLPLLAEDPANIDREKSRSAGLYGPEHGAARLLAVLTDLDLTADWFLPGEIARRYPEVALAVRDAGHAIGVHGDRHLHFDRLSAQEQIDEMLAGRNAIAQVTGRMPQGFRTPAGEWSPAFLPAMQEAGFRWSSSLPSDELPFHLTGTDLVEIPFRYELEDQQYLGYNLDPPFPPGQSRITPLESVEENWWCEIRGAERYGTLVHLRLNAEVMGTPGRAQMLQRFLEGVQSTGRAWFATCGDLHALFAGSDPDPSHPYRLFTDLTSGRA